MPDNNETKGSVDFFTDIDTPLPPETPPKWVQSAERMSSPLLPTPQQPSPLVEDKATEDTSTEDAQQISVRQAPVQPSVAIDVESKYTNSVPTIMGENFSSKFIQAVNQISLSYKMLPELNYDETYAEFADLNVAVSPTPTLQILNQELEKAQGAKERLAELDIAITQCYVFKERAVDILLEAILLYSDEKSADKRKGYAAISLMNFSLDLAKTESLYKGCKIILNNLISLQDTLSRKITNIQLQIKLMDTGRTMLPDFDFTKRDGVFAASEDMLRDRQSIKSDGTTPEVKEQDF